MKATTRSAVFLLCASLSALATDLTLTMTGTGKGHAGEQTQYWSAKFMRINNGGNQMDTMVDFEQGVSYNIDHKKKLIQRIGWDDLEASMKAMSEKMEAMSEKMKDLPPSVQKMMGGRRYHRHGRGAGLRDHSRPQVPQVEGHHGLDDSREQP